MKLALFLLAGLALARPAHATPSPGYDAKWYEMLPTGRVWAGAALDPVHRMLYVYGGVHWTITEDFYVYDLAAPPGALAWRRLPTDGLPHPHRLYGAATTWDTRRGRMLLHGGESEDGDVDELWAYDPATSGWTRILTAPGGPSPRLAHAAAYDSVSDVLWLLGGARRTEQPDSCQLWALALSADPPTWRRVDAPGNGPRAAYRPSLAVETSPHRLVAVDGYTRNSPDTARVFALELTPDTTWIKLGGGTDPPRDHLEYPAVYDAVRRRLLVVPDPMAKLARTELWEFGLDGSGWRLILVPDPALAPHTLKTLAYEPASGQVLQVGGVTQTMEGAARFEADIWRLQPDDGAAWTPLGGAALRTPPSRVGEAWALDPTGGKLYIFGGDSASGFGYGTLGDVWSVDLAGAPAWREEMTTAEGPGARWRACGAFDTRRGRMIIFGGYVPGSTRRSDALAFDVATRTWTALAVAGTPPSPRTSATAVYDSLADRVVIYGGDDGHPCADVWALELAGSSPRWRELHPLGIAPPARSFHTAVLDTRRNAMWIYGGAGRDDAGAVLLADAWRLDLAGPGLWSPAQETTHAPSGRQQQAAAYDPLRDRMVVIWGSVLSETRRTDCFALDFDNGPAWRILGLEGISPYPRAEAICAWDAPRDRLILYGGSTGFAATVGDLWAAEWTPAPPPPPATEAIALRAKIRPNPSQGQAAIELTLSADATVFASIYDVHGRLVRQLEGGPRAAGPVSLGWDGRDEHGARARAGVYAVRLEVGDQVTRQKLVLLP